MLTETDSMEVVHASADKLLGNGQFGVTFFTSSKREEICGTNGLPLTPNSIRILGRGQYLKSLIHPNLAQYIDIIRGKHERIIIVSEYYGMNLRSFLRIQEREPLTDEQLFKIAKDVLRGLVYLNNHGIVCRNLSLDNIIFNSNNEEVKDVKLFNYGIHYMTNFGNYVAFPIGNPKYVAPEIFLSKMKKAHHLPSCDVWSLGIILLELFIRKELWTELKLPQIIRKISSFTLCENNVLQRILQEHQCPDIVQGINPKFKLVLDKCLEINPAIRVSPKQLLQDIEGSLIANGDCTDSIILSNGQPKISSFHNSKFISSLSLSDDVRKYQTEQDVISGLKLKDTIDSTSTEFTQTDHLGNRTFKEVYHFWQLAGGDVMAELKRQGLTRKKAAILTLPSSMTIEGKLVGKEKDRGLLLDHTVIILPMHELRKRLSAISPELYYPLVNPNRPLLLKEITYVARETESLPLIIREKDIEYQFKRIVLFDRLIKGYPFTRDIIHKESLLDIPPFFRAEIWSCLLDVKGDVEGMYSGIDKDTPTSTDRQIEVDIPRCHQYDELLSSPSGHEKFKRVLKAWVVSNKEYVYWQGLDSLCAPFLYLNFNNEAMAYACLSAFIPRYLYNFFLKDNSAVIQEYLATFSQLIAFHDSTLTTHLDSIGFIPELYAIPWFLTMFSHVFPLHKIFHIWDKLLLGDSSFSLCVGLAILYQLREGLLSSGFNECILLFSDMPEIDIEKCVKDSVEIYNSTPRHIVSRKHEPPSKNGMLKRLVLN